MTTETQLVRFDWAIKSLLRDQANFDILEGFLSAILRKDIFVIKILDSESNQSEKKPNFNCVDILVKDQNQKNIIIEIQTHRKTGYLKRILWGVSKLIVDKELGKDYQNVSRVISISILYFNLGLDDDYIYHNPNEFHGLHTKKPMFFRELDPETRQLVERKSQEVFPEYYLINVESFQDVIANDLDEWIYLLKHSALRSDFKAKNIDKVREKLTLLSMEPEERKRYENYIRNQVVKKNVIEIARKEGEKLAKLEIAQKMLEQGISIETIASLTGLSVDVINQA